MRPVRVVGGRGAVRPVGVVVVRVLPGVGVLVNWLLRRAVVLGLAVKHGAPGAVRVGVVRGAADAVVVIVVVVGVDGRVGLLVVGRHGEGGLVWINVLAGLALDVGVAGQYAVELVVLERVGADKGRDAPEQDLEECQAHNRLADVAAISARVGRVVGRLTGKSRQPEDGKETVNDEHGMRVCDKLRSFPPWCHDQIDGARQREKALFPGDAQVSNSSTQCFVTSQVAQNGKGVSSYQTKWPTIVAIYHGIICAEKDDLEDEDDKAEQNLHRVQA